MRIVVSTHSDCVHALIGMHAVYCCRTQLVYIRPDGIPTERTRKVRGDELDVFSRHVRQCHRALRGVSVSGYVCMTRVYKPPVGAVMLPDVIALRRHLAVIADEVGDK